MAAMNTATDYTPTIKVNTVAGVATVITLVKFFKALKKINADGFVTIDGEQYDASTATFQFN